MIDLIERYFTKDDFHVENINDPYNVYDSFKWKKVDVEIKDFATREIIYQGKDLEFPEHYSQQACDIIASKYFFRDIDGEGTPETSLRQVIHRMAMFWTEALIDEGVLDGFWIATDKERDKPFNFFTMDAGIFYDEVVYTLLSQMWAPNSPQWFNTGLGLAYGLKGESDELYYCDEEGVHKSPDRYTRSQTSACFIIPVTDHLIGKNSITDHFVTETKLFKGGSGVGTNFSPIRAAGEKLSSGGESSGVMSFLLGLDRNAGAIKSGGTTRRAAKMVILDIDHPDIEDFIDWKVHEEKKARDLVSLGYDGSITGEAYQTVSGQNSNNSVRVSKEFMDKILGNDPDPTWKLKGRRDPSKDREVDAHDLWHKIAQAAWECADPGIQFDDLYNEWHTAPAAGRIHATNPCSEYAFIDNSACNLASINVLKFYDGILDTQGIDTYGFTRLVHLVQLVLEASIHWGQFPTEEVAENSYKYRPTGLGLTNLGALFLNCGIAYDSDKARNTAKFIAGLMTGQSYLTSARLAQKVGACEGYEENESALLTVLSKHEYESKHDEVFNLFHTAYTLAITTGVRNMQTTVMAPTGTISFAMDCLTTGIEPFFSHKFYKKCSDGSVMEMVNPMAKEYVDLITTISCEEEYEVINDYFDDHGTYQGCSNLTPEEEKVLETANEITPKAHIDMMAAIQPMISGSISKTVNLPSDSTVEDIEFIYEYAYKAGCKSISIYRDGSKGTQPLNTEVEDTDDFDFDVTKEEVSKVQELPYLDSIPKEEFLPKKISLSVHDNQNILIRSSQEQIDVESNEPILVLDEEDSEELPNDLNYITCTEIPDDPFVVVNKIDDSQNIHMKRFGDCVYFKSNQPLEPVLVNTPIVALKKPATKENLKEIYDLLEPEDDEIETLQELKDKGIIEIEHDKLDEPNIENPPKLERVKPDGIRYSTTHSAKIGNVELYITVSYYDSNELYEPTRLCEIFVSSDKEGTEIKGLLSSLSKAISHMLQYGIDPLKIAEMLRNQRYEPQGYVERHPYIKMCTSISDLIARVIEYECGDYSRCQVKPEEPKLSDSLVASKDFMQFEDPYENKPDDYGTGYDEFEVKAEELIDKRKDLYQDLANNDKLNEDNLLKGNNFTGNECPVCHSKRVIQNGTCEVCLSCGSQSSCS